MRWGFVRGEPAPTRGGDGRVAACLAERRASGSELPSAPRLAQARSGCAGPAHLGSGASVTGTRRPPPFLRMAAQVGTPLPRAGCGPASGRWPPGLSPLPAPPRPSGRGAPPGATHEINLNAMGVVDVASRRHGVLLRLVGSTAKADIRPFEPLAAPHLAQSRPFRDDSAPAKYARPLALCLRPSTKLAFGLTPAAELEWTHGRRGSIAVPAPVHDSGPRSRAEKNAYDHRSCSFRA